MPTGSAQARRVLVLMDMGLSVPSAMVAGLQYRELFAQRPGYEVSFESVMVPPQDWHTGVFGFLRRVRLHRLVDWLEVRRLARHQEKILQRARDCDVVVEIKSSDV